MHLHLIYMHVQQLQAQVWCERDGEDRRRRPRRLARVPHRARACHPAHQPRPRRRRAAGPELVRPALALYRQPDRHLRVNELAREVVLSPTAMSRFVDRVEGAGYVRREPDPTDRRALHVAITDDGVALLRRMWPVYERGIERHFAAYLGKSAPRVRAMLERMVAAAR